MTKAKTPAPEAETQTEGQDTVAASTEGQDTVAASTEGQDTVTASTEGQDQAGAAEGGGPMHEPATLNVEALTYCARQIDMLNTSGHRLGLIDELKQLYGMEITEDEVDGVTVSCEGITIDPADTVENALTNWANAARRASLAAA
jgi:hypothetical protein